MIGVLGMEGMGRGEGGGGGTGNYGVHLGVQENIRENKLRGDPIF